MSINISYICVIASIKNDDCFLKKKLKGGHAHDDTCSRVMLEMKQIYAC